jgi:hypothetical protein
VVVFSFFALKKCFEGLINQDVKKELEKIKTELSEKKAFRASIGKQKGDLYPYVCGLCNNIRVQSRDLLNALRERSLLDSELFDTLSSKVLELKEVIYDNHTLLQPELYPIAHKIKREGLNFYVNFDILSADYCAHLENYQPLKVSKKEISVERIDEEISRLKKYIELQKNKFENFFNAVKLRNFGNLCTYIEWYVFLGEDGRFLREVTDIIKKDHCSADNAMVLVFNKLLSPLRTPSAMKLDYCSFIRVLIKDYYQNGLDKNAKDFLALANDGEIFKRQDTPHLLNSRIINFAFSDNPERFLEIYDKMHKTYEEIEGLYKKIEKIMGKLA